MPGTVGAVIDPDRWLADEAVRRAVDERRARQWDELVTSSGSTLAGVLVDAAEAGGEVTLETVTGRTVTVRVTAVAADHIRVSAPDGAVGILRLGAVATVAGGPPGPGSGRRGPDPRDLVEALAGLAEERPEVVVRIAGRTEPLRGRLDAVGVDVCTIRQPHRAVRVATGAVTEVWWDT